MIYRPGLCFSTFYLTLVAEFGRAGGFQTIVDKVTQRPQRKGELSIDLLFAYLELLEAPSRLYHRAYVSEAITPFLRAALEYMSDIPDEQLRSVKREKVDSALNDIDRLMRRVYTAKTKGEESIKLRVGIALSLLRSELLERRIQAVRLIAETCKAAKASQAAAWESGLPAANDSTVLSSLLQVPRVIDEIFGKKSHIQLIQRSIEILKFVLVYSDITREDINVIWECCIHDEQSKIEIFKVISEAAYLLPSGLIGFIVDKFLAVPKAALKDQDIVLLYELGWKSSKASLNTLQEIFKIQWQAILGDLPGLSSQVYGKNLTRFCDVITTPTIVPEANMQVFLGSAYEMLDKVLRDRLIHNRGSSRRWQSKCSEYAFTSCRGLSDTPLG